jgi:dUTP pyrophosphatase
MGLFEDAAFDLYATEDLLFQYGQRKMVGTKLSFIIPDGYWLKLRERSGMASKGIHLLGGVIDSGYTGEVKVILWSCSPDPVSITMDKAICQFTVERLNKATIEELSFASFTTEANERQRGCKGFGSSDVKS